MSNDTTGRAATARLGTLETREGRHVLRYERSLAHPVERVWAAIAEPAALLGWLGEVELDPRKGGAVVIRWLNTDEEGNRAILHGTVTAIEPPRVLELDTDLHGVLRWELGAEGPGTRLVFTASYPAPNDQVTLALAGWHIHLDHLAEALEGRPVDWPRWTEEHFGAWSALHERYLAAPA